MASEVAYAGEEAPAAMPLVGTPFESICSLQLKGHEDAPPYCVALGLSAKGDKIAAVTSEKEIAILEFPGLQPVRSLIGHKGPIGGAGFFKEGMENCFFSAGGEHDGTLLLWDLRQEKPVSTLRGEDAELYCADVNVDNTIIAAGGQEAIYCWDLRTMNRVRKYEEGHADDITQMVFHPTRPSILCSASTDGLICQADVTIADDNDAFQTVLPTETSVSRIGLFGPDACYLYCVTHVETLGFWNLDTAALLYDTGDTRKNVLTTTHFPAEYLIDCTLNSRNGKLNLVTGTSSGEIALLEVSTSGFSGVASLYGKHSDIVRDFVADLSQGWILTGGEDGIVSLWTPRSSNSSAE